MIKATADWKPKLPAGNFYCSSMELGNYPEHYKQRLMKRWVTDNPGLDLLRYKIVCTCVPYSIGLCDYWYTITMHKMLIGTFKRSILAVPVNSRVYNA